MINLGKVVFVDMDENLKEEIKKDISKFELLAGELPHNKEIRICNLIHSEVIQLDCGYITQFNFPEGSTGNHIENRGSEGRQTGIKLTFNYNNKHYQIYSHN